MKLNFTLNFKRHSLHHSKSLRFVNSDLVSRRKATKSPAGNSFARNKIAEKKIIAATCRPNRHEDRCKSTEQTRTVFIFMLIAMSRVQTGLRSLIHDAGDGFKTQGNVLQASTTVHDSGLLVVII